PVPAGARPRGDRGAGDARGRSAEGDPESMRLLLAAVLALGLLTPVSASAVPEGQLTWATHFTIAPTFCDPAEAPGLITPFMMFYALHDALLKPMPGKAMAPSLAESW